MMIISGLLKDKSKKSKAIILGALGLVFGIFYFLNWIVYKLIGFFVGSIISFILILTTYYLMLRGLVRMLAFPGITTLMQRTLEFDFCKRMASQVLRNATDLKSSLEFFMGPHPHQDSENTNMLHLGKTIRYFNVVFSRNENGASHRVTRGSIRSAKRVSSNCALGLTRLYAQAGCTKGQNASLNSEILGSRVHTVGFCTAQRVTSFNLNCLHSRG
jgi:hypothetical protein